METKAKTTAGPAAETTTRKDVPEEEAPAGEHGSAAAREAPAGLQAPGAAVQEPGALQFKPQGYLIAYRSRGLRREIRYEGLRGLSNDELELELSFDGELLRVAVVPRRRIVVERLRVELAHAFARGERCMPNGWQSWTDTRWRARGEAMRGLRGVPRALVRRFVLDGSGDYRFHPYDGRAGHLHGWTYAELRRGDAYGLVASTDEAHGFTLVELDTVAGTITLETEPPARELAAGTRVLLASYALLGGTRREAFDRWFGLSGIRARQVPPLVGYSSWYRHYGDIDEACLLHDLAGAKRELGALDLAGCRPVFQMDDGWAKVGDWLEPDTARFPHGMSPLAAQIAADGLLPGLWIAPFVCERDSCLFRERPDWLLRDAVGRAVPTGSHWSGAFALDTLNPEVRAYVRAVIRTATENWGFGFLKLDFLYAACMLPHGGKNRGELMADAVALLRDAAGEHVLLDGCGVPLASAFGVFDYCRIGCDVGLDWDGAPPLRLAGRERVSTKNSLAATLARSPLDGRAFGCDPDVVFLRDDVKLTRAQHRRLLNADATSASMLLTSDDMGAWGADERALYQQAVRVLGQRRRTR